MKIIEFIKKYQIILFLSFLVIVMLIIRSVYGTKKNEVEISVPTPTPTIVKPKQIDGINYEVLNDVNPNYPLKKVLPYTTENFSIIGYDEPFTLVVRSKSGDQIANEKEIREWIEQYIPGDKAHKFLFLK